MSLPGAVTEFERRAAWACAAVALAAGFGVPLLWSVSISIISRSLGGLDTAYYGYSALWQISAAAALVAVVLTRIRWVGVSIAVVTSLLTTVVGTAELVVRGGDPEVGAVVGWLLVAAVTGTKLLAADLMARRLGHFTALTGALAGVLVGLLGSLITLASNGLGLGGGRLDLLPPAFWISAFVLAPVLLGATGLVAGHFAAQRASVSA